KMGGWRGEVVYCALLARQSTHLLSLRYGSDIEALIPDFKHVYPAFEVCVDISSCVVVYSAYWSSGYPWYKVFIVWSTFSSFVEFAYLAFLTILKFR
ncbi:hypothetical protein EK21DRAFT_80913, partial [Setomelanomma holmii]